MRRFPNSEHTPEARREGLDAIDQAGSGWMSRMKRSMDALRILGELIDEAK